MKELKNTNVLVFMSLCIVVNFIGAYIALLAKLPIYLDSIGTILSAVMLGPTCGAITGGLTALINGSTFDPISLYFLPVQVVAGISTGLLFKTKQFEGIKSIAKIILVAILVAIMSAVVVSFVFDGVTSSGSSLIVAVLKNSGINMIASVFSTQIFTDLLDKFVIFGLVFGIIKTIPSNVKIKLIKHM